MKNIVIYYFSGTGNTWWVAQELKKNLSSKKNNVEVFSIETLTLEEIISQVNNCDHIVLGFPVYGSTAPKLFLDFINNLPFAQNSQTLTVFSTQALASGDAAYHVGKKLIDKGYSLRQAAHFRMMNNLHIPQFKFYPPKNDQRVNDLHNKSLPKINRLSDKINNNKSYITGKHSLGTILGKFQRKNVDKFIDKVSSQFYINSSTCINCDKCQRICPTQNIVKTENSYLFDTNCNFCMRCYSQCPQAAILIGAESIDEEKYPRYKGPKDGFDVSLLIKK